MRHITFIGTLDSTFASRWKRKLSPKGVIEGKNITKDIAKNKGLNPELEKRILERKFSREEWRNTLNLEYDNRPGFNGKRENDALTRTTRQNRQKRIKELSEKARENPIKRETPLSKFAVKSNESVKVPTKTSQVPRSNPSPRINSKSATPLLQTKKLPIGKIGLGAVGLATVGALGYGLLRKSRNDKGKSRGKYRK